jgi:serine phosphatase RsbU (regulator of sigma subunit)
MNFFTYPIKRLLKPFNLILLSVSLIIIQLLVPLPKKALAHYLLEILVFSTLVLMAIYFAQWIGKRRDRPLLLVGINGLIGTVILILFFVFGNIIFEETLGAFSKIFLILLFYLFLLYMALFISIYRELFFLQQKKNPKIYFVLMMVIFSLNFWFANLMAMESAFTFSIFTISAIVIITINSLRVAWIAFLRKKQKFLLLVYSLCFASVFSIIFELSLSESFFTRLLWTFSPGLLDLFRVLMLYGAAYLGIVFFVTLFHLPTAEIIDRKTVETSSLTDFSRIITQAFNFRELVNNITAIVKKVCNSDAAWFVTPEPDGFWLHSCNNIKFETAQTVSNLLIENVTFKKDETVILSKKEIDDLLGSNFNFKQLKTIVILPLYQQNNIKGYIFASCHKTFGFDEDDVKALRTFAGYATVALENANLLKERLEKERMEKELDVAREIQRKILPGKIPQFKQLKIAAYFSPAFEVGGDYYDFFNIDQQKLALVISDVSGKGISAAFIMAEIKGIFESLSTLFKSPRKLLIKANEILKGSLEKNRFVTVIYGIIDLKTGILKLSRGGHPPVIHYSQGKVTKVLPNGIGLGLLAGRRFSQRLEEAEIKLTSGDLLVFITDGISESKNIEERDFGYEPIEDILKSNPIEKPARLIEKIVNEIKAYSRDMPQHDDITLLVMKWQS